MNRFAYRQALTIEEAVALMSQEEGEHGDAGAMPQLASPQPSDPFPDTSA